MKTTILKTTRLFAIAIAATTLLSISNAAVAGIGEDSSEKPVVVKYLGTVASQPLFQLSVQNEAQDDLTITLENTDGDVLYSQKTKEKSFNKKIQLETTETEINLNLYVYSAKTKTKQLYQINKVTKTNFVDDVVVNLKN